jgi:hypothetical protein
MQITWGNIAYSGRPVRAGSPVVAGDRLGHTAGRAAVRVRELLFRE